MHLKHDLIRFGCIKQLNLLAVLGWVGLGPNFFTCSGFGLVWVGQLMGWVGSGHTKWTHDNSDTNIQFIQTDPPTYTHGLYNNDCTYM